MLSTHIAPFRRVNPAILAAQLLAFNCLENPVEKSELAIALKRSAPVLKITGIPYQILDILLGLVRKEDMQAGKRPLVAISNEKLAQYTDRSTRTVSRCIKRLVEAGVISYADSPNGRRFVRRGQSGAIDYGYGLDLTPACKRLDELKAIAHSFQERLKLEKQAKRTTLGRARTIKDLAGLLGKEGEQQVACMEEAFSRPMGVFERADAIEVIYQKILHLEANLTCLGDKNGVPISKTTHKHLKTEVVNSRHNSNDLSLDGFSSNGAKTAVKMGYEKKQTANSENFQKNTMQMQHQNWHSSTDLPSMGLTGVSIGLLDQACPQIRELLEINLVRWKGLFEITDDLRHLIGLSEAGWKSACAAQGLHLSSACLAVVCEKSLRDPEAISRPAGYFRAMIDRANDGKLNLQKTVFGLVKEKCKTK